MIIRVTFVLGLRTDTLFTDGKVIEKSTYKHMERKRSNVVSLLERIQRNHQKQLFQEANVSMQSQEAYELAEQGINQTCLYSRSVKKSQNTLFQCQNMALNWSISQSSIEAN